MRPCRLSQAFQIGDGKSVVRVFGQIRGVVEHDKRQDHLLERDLVHRDPLLIEMCRRIDVRAVLPNHLVVGGPKAVLGDRIRLGGFRIGCRSHFCLTKARPYRRIRSEALRKVDELL